MENMLINMNSDGFLFDDFQEAFAKPVEFRN
jgi:hypothetical protein